MALRSRLAYHQTIPARDRYAPPPPDEKGGEKVDEKEPPKRIDRVPGAFVQLDVEPKHYLGSGIEVAIVALFRSNVIFNSTKRGPQAAVVNKQRPLVAGLAFDEASERSGARPSSGTSQPGVVP